MDYPNRWKWLNDCMTMNSIICFFVCKCVCTSCQSVNVAGLDLSMNYLHRRIDPKAYIVLHTHIYNRSYAKKIFMKIFKYIIKNCIELLFCNKFIKLLL